MIRCPKCDIGTLQQYISNNETHLVCELCGHTEKRETQSYDVETSSDNCILTIDMNKFIPANFLPRKPRKPTEAFCYICKYCFDKVDNGYTDLITHKNICKHKEKFIV